MKLLTLTPLLQRYQIIIFSTYPFKLLFHYNLYVQLNFGITMDESCAFNLYKQLFYLKYLITIISHLPFLCLTKG